MQVQLAAHQPRVHLLFQVLAAARILFGPQQQLQGAVGPLQQDGRVGGDAEQKGAHGQVFFRPLVKRFHQRQRFGRLARG